MQFKIDNVKFADSELKTIISVIPPVVEKEAMPGEQPEKAAEPEVISKGKKPAEGEEAAKTPAKK